MVKDGEVRLLMDYLNKGKSLKLSAAKSEKSEKTARKYRDSGQFPSQMKVEHTWRTRQDPFEDIWKSTIKRFVENNPGLEAKTILDYLQREYKECRVGSGEFTRNKSRFCSTCRQLLISENDRTL